jgi:hypothetical protein
MSSIRRRFALAGTIAALAAGFGGAAAVTPVALAKSCSSGYTQATISGAVKCLRRGQYCARAADSQYHRYGYHCHKRDANGDYHLT